MAYQGWAYRRRYLLLKASSTLRLLSKSSSPPFRLAVHAMFQNEAPYLAEWVEHHLALGFDHVFLTNDASTDHYLKVLQPYRDKGLLTLEDARPDLDFFAREEWHKNRLLREQGRYFRWMAFLDTDEFIFCPRVDLRAWLKARNRTPGFVLNWFVFGTSGVEKAAPGEDLRGLLRYRFPQGHHEHRNVKALVQPAKGFRFFNQNPHYPQYSPLARLRHPGGQRFHPARPRIERYPLSINHYWYRTEHFYREVKKPRRAFFQGGPRPAHIEAWHRRESNRVLDLGLAQRKASPRAVEH
ncbi:MAG: glycosyltransferase family 2 protein [Schleiferiaceae bacterium]|nr:glycosyltransferase family 2 protein [Schleiferiaceae bacterium]